MPVRRSTVKFAYRLTGIPLQPAAVSHCLKHGSGTVTIDELLRAVNNALHVEALAVINAWIDQLQLPACQ